MRILIADGSLVVTERLTDLMSEIPSVELLPPTATGEATLESVRANDPEVLVMDARILDGNGRGFLKTVRSEKPTTIVIILSNLSSPQYRKHYETAGADLFMDKSNEFVYLYHFVRELVSSTQRVRGWESEAGIRRQLARTKLRVGFQLGLFVFSVMSLFVGPLARGAGLILAAQGKEECPYARRVTTISEVKRI